MKLTLTPEQIDLLTKQEVEVLTIKKNKAIAEIEKQFTIAVTKLAGKYKTVEVSVESDELEVPEVDEKETEYLKLSRRIASKLTKARKAGNVIDVEKLESERNELNLRFNKKSRK